MTPAHETVQPPAPARTPAPPDHQPSSTAATPDATVRRLRAVAMASLLSLIVLCIAWEAWLAPTGSGTLVVKVLPLLLCVPGVARHRMFTFRWLSLLVWLYVTEGLVRATTEQGAGRWLAVAETALCTLLFVASAAYIRRRLRAGHAAAAVAPA